MLFGKKEKGPSYIIAGLGNFPPKYEGTRHNAGFIFADRLAEEYHFDISKKRFHSLTGEVTLAGQRCLVLKPLTFMNNSGEAVAAAARFYKIKPENVLVIFDDISLPPGGVRLRKKGSDGGHNGIKSIVAHLNSEDFPRIKLGVGAKPHPDYDLADWVTSKFKKDERKAFDEAVEHTLGAVEMIISGEFEKAMNQFNRKG